LRLAILGTKGIPNQYGGFEQFAEYLSKGLVERGHEVTVYNPHFHQFQGTEYAGVKIERVFSPEKVIGAAANYIYDFLCLRHALNCNYDIIYEAGYGSVAVSYLLLPLQRSLILTNMDGLEWKRAKWNKVIQRVTRYAERIAVKRSDYIISDNIGIQAYYKKEFRKDSFYLPYGATVVNTFDPAVLDLYQLSQKSYYLVIARMEPENNIEVILDAFVNAPVAEQLVLIGNVANAYGKKMTRQFNHPRIKFSGGIYDKRHLDSLRYFSKGYLHGHSVGGTNPSLLEAMACQCNIIAHKNSFNSSVLTENAVYFNDAGELTNIFEAFDPTREHHGKFRQNNLNRIKEYYDWDKVIGDHEKLFNELLESGRKFPKADVIRAKGKP